MKKVVVSCGPIPARLDSVKFLTNRFKGGLAFETARRLAAEDDMEVTVVKWVHTPLPWDDSMAYENISDVVNVTDVVEYAEWFESHAAEYDAFVMAAAVANLMPSEPYEGKFPSHLYKVGNKFDIKFEIAPRAIDVIKRINPRCCLIGYKLFDADSDKELIDIARHTLEDAKANVIFANRPKDAKSRKIAITADGAAIPMTFDDHIEFMMKAIRADYFRTENVDIQGIEKKIREGLGLTEYFESTFPQFGTIAFRIKGVGMVTTSRGHKGRPVLVTGVDFDKRIITCMGGKATLNAPALWKMLEDDPEVDYVIHRHFDDPMATHYESMDMQEIEYEFPGTMDEVNAVQGKGAVAIRNHGYMVPHKFKDVDWGRYYELFPRKYFNTRGEIARVLAYAEAHPELMSLEVGGNTTCRCRYNLDPAMKGEGVIGYDDLKDMKFDIIVARNSINYLSKDELDKVMAALKEGGIFIANSFAKAVDIKVTPSSHEVAVKHILENGVAVISHFLMDGDDIYAHSFYGRDINDYAAMGFNVVRDDRSIIISKGWGLITDKGITGHMENMLQCK